MKTEVARSSNFSQYKGHNSSLSSLFYSHSNNLPLNQSDHLLLQFLDKLDKQDPTTRLKSAKSITQLLKQNTVTDYRVEKFVFIFGKLALIEPDPLVRIALSETLEHYFICSKKSFQPFFKSNYYLIKSCSYDETQKVANSYIKAISALGGDKILNNIYNYVKDDLSIHIKFVLSKPYSEYIKKWKKSFAISHDQLEKCYSRYITAILKFIILDVQIDDYPNIWAEIRDLVWDFLVFSSFETTNPFSIRISASMLIDKAIQSNIDIYPTDIKSISKSLCKYYNSESEYIAENCVVLFKNLINIKQIDDKIDIKRMIKDILINDTNTKTDGRFGNKSFCMNLSEMIITSGDYFRELIPQFIIQMQNPQSIEQLIDHYNSNDEVIKLLLNKISSILKLESISSSELLETLTDIINNYDKEKMQLPYITPESDYPKTIPFIPSILKLKTKFNQDINKLIQFVMFEMIPQLIPGNGKFNTNLINKLTSAMRVFDKCKEYGNNIEFNRIDNIDFYPLSLNTNTTNGLEDRISMDIKLANTYFKHLYQIGINVNIVNNEDKNTCDNTNTSFSVNNFWISCLEYFVGISTTLSTIMEMIPQLSSDAKLYVKNLISHENFDDIDKINELFHKCYKMGNYELASILSIDSNTHLLCLKAGYPPESYPLKSYVSNEIIEALINNVIDLLVYNVSIDIICKKLPDIYIESLYKIIFIDGIERFTHEQLEIIPQLVKIIPINCREDLTDKVKQLTTLTGIINPCNEIAELDVSLTTEIMMKINLGSDLFATSKIFENFKKYPGIPTMSNYVVNKVYSHKPESGAMLERILSDDIDDIPDFSDLPIYLKWLIPLIILENVDNVSNSLKFRYCLTNYIKAINEIDVNSTYFILKFCKKFVTQFETPHNKDYDFNRLKFSFSEYINELSQIITLIDPEEFEYDSRCFILSLFYSIQSLDNIKYVDELNEYLENILHSLNPIYMDILIGSKDQHIIKLGISMFGKLIKNDNFLKPQNFDTELDIISTQSINEDNVNIYKKSSEYQYELESRYPNFLKILLGYVESTPLIYVSVWKILIEYDTTIPFPNYDQLDIFINEIISMYINGSCDVSKMNLLIFRRFPQYILDRMDNQSIRYFISDIITELIQNEVELMNKWKIVASFKALTIAGTFKAENMQNINFKIHLTENYPFEEATFNVNKNEIIGVSKKQALSWLESSKNLLKLGKIALAVKNIKENISQFYKGVSECNICLAAFHTESKTLANKKCQVCKNTFHSFCLLRWFRTSHKPKCPICQSHTAIAFPKRTNTNNTN